MVQNFEVNKLLQTTLREGSSINHFPVAFTILPPKWLFTALEGAQEDEAQGLEVLGAVEVEEEPEAVVLEAEVDSEADEGSQYSTVLE